jgi:hypothetical protein
MRRSETAILCCVARAVSGAGDPALYQAARNEGSGALSCG